MEVFGKTLRRQWLTLVVTALIGESLLPGAQAGQGWYSPGLGGYCRTPLTGFRSGFSCGYPYSGIRGFGSHGALLRRPTQSSVVYYPRSPLSHFNSYGYGGYGAYSHYGYGSALPGFHGVRPFPFAGPRIYVYPQTAAATTTAAPSGPAYRRIIILFPEPTDSDAYPDHTLAPVPDEAALRPLRPDPVDPQQAWSYLERGLHQHALTAFGELARANPETGIHKVGFGLAAALAGDKITAAYALRCAFQTDPEGSGLVPGSPILRAKLENLAASYKSAVRRDLNDLNLRFLLAATSHLIQDNPTAMAYLDKSISAGEDAPSTLNLKRMVEKESGHGSKSISGSSK